MARRVFIHVGTPNSGTTYVQTILWHNPERLLKDSVLLPGRPRTQGAAARAITSHPDAPPDIAKGSAPTVAPPPIAEPWPRLAQQISRWHGDAIVTHDLLSPATRSQADAALALLGEAEIHIVISGRALHAKLPASWREQVRNGSGTPYAQYLQRVRSHASSVDWFWEMQDVGDVAKRWAGTLPPEHVHVLTVPEIARRPVLWDRFATTVGLDPAAYATDIPIRAMSLGAVEVEMLRMVHAVNDERFTGHDRQRWTKRLLAKHVLGQRHGAPLRMPAGSEPWVATATSEMVEAIRAAGYDVVGDLAELAWQEPDPAARDISDVTTQELIEASEWTIARLQEELVERQPVAPPPPVGPDDGAEGILELLEHIRAADLGVTPREPSVRRTSASARLRRSLTAFRGR